MQPKEIARAWFDMCARGDRDRFADLATEDYVPHGPGGAGTRDDFADWLQWYSASFAEQRPVMEDAIEAGDRLVIRYTVRSVYRGGYLDLPAADQKVHETGIMIFRFHDGKVAETWFEGNDLEVAQQLGGHVQVQG